jgi:hypothetical protein
MNNLLDDWNSQHDKLDMIFKRSCYQNNADGWNSTVKYMDSSNKAYFVIWHRQQFHTTVCGTEPSWTTTKLYNHV